MGATATVNASEFETKVLKSDKPVLVDFWATWCGPCLAIGPAVDQVATDFQGQAEVFKLDVDANQDLASSYGILSIPAFLVFKDGQVVDRMIGAAGGKESLVNLIKKHI